jgi:hypothetical protein
MWRGSDFYQRTPVLLVQQTSFGRSNPGVHVWGVFSGPLDWWSKRARHIPNDFAMLHRRYSPSRERPSIAVTINLKHHRRIDVTPSEKVSVQGMREPTFGHRVTRCSQCLSGNLTSINRWPVRGPMPNTTPIDVTINVLKLKKRKHFFVGSRQFNHVKVLV